MSQEQKCGPCGGSGLTQKTEHRVELDKDGNQIHVPHTYLGPCNACHGSGQG
ncbi:hypothetical protein [Streptomyces sp. NPDC085596]|uniref:hypothetical protein n=1 Tax=Streptomyces sp. NPDC085596 TaxID=3365731 RepID=UPI0037D958C7